MARPPGKKFERLKGYEKIYETKLTEGERLSAAEV
jgi:hypothetical protein